MRKKMELMFKLEQDRQKMLDASLRDKRLLQEYSDNPKHWALELLDIIVVVVIFAFVIEIIYVNGVVITKHGLIGAGGITIAVFLWLLMIQNFPE